MNRILVSNEKMCLLDWMRTEEGKKWLILLIFVALTTASFVSYFSFAPTGIFSQPATVYNISTIAGEPVTGNFTAQVNTTKVSSGPPGFTLPGSSPIKLVSAFVVGALSAIISISAIIYYNRSPAKNAIIGALISSILPLVILFVGGANINAASLLGVVIYFVLIVALFYPASDNLTPDPPIHPQRYIQKHARFAQASISIGLAIAIGGALTLGAATTTRSVPVATFVGIFFFPLAGVSAIEYYRLHRIEENNRPREPETFPLIVHNERDPIVYELKDIYCDQEFEKAEIEEFISDLNEQVEQSADNDHDDDDK